MQSIGTSGAALNRRLALLLGWSNITEAGGALLGTPPDGGGNSRGQAAVPDWCGDWSATGPLMVAHTCSHATDDGVRQALVRSVIDKLEMR